MSETSEMLLNYPKYLEYAWGSLQYSHVGKSHVSGQAQELTEINNQINGKILRS